MPSPCGLFSFVLFCCMLSLTVCSAGVIVVVAFGFVLFVLLHVVSDGLLCRCGC